MVGFAVAKADYLLPTIIGPCRGRGRRSPQGKWGVVGRRGGESIHRFLLPRAPARSFFVEPRRMSSYCPRRAPLARRNHIACRLARWRRSVCPDNSETSPAIYDGRETITAERFTPSLCCLLIYKGPSIHNDMCGSFTRTLSFSEYPLRLNWWIIPSFLYGCNYPTSDGAYSKTTRRGG